MYLNHRPTPNDKPIVSNLLNTNWYCGSSSHTCAFTFGICLLALALLDSGLIIVSRFWWGFIGVGLGLICALFLLVGTLISKHLVYLPFFGVCLLNFIITVALLIYSLLTGINQLHLNRGDAKFDEKIDWSSESIQGILNLIFSALSLLKIGVLVGAFGAAFANFLTLKRERIQPIRSRVAAFTTRCNRDEPRNVVENVEIVEEEQQHSERVSTPYY